MGEESVCKGTFLFLFFEILESVFVSGRLENKRIFVTQKYFADRRMQDGSKGDMIC